MNFITEAVDNVDLQYYIDKLEIIDTLDHNEFLKAFPKNEIIIGLTERADDAEKIQSYKFKEENEYFEKNFEVDYISEEVNAEKEDSKVLDAIKWHQNIKSFVMRY